VWGGLARAPVNVPPPVPPRELPVPCACPSGIVDPQLQLAVEVVLVLGYPLEDPEPPLGQPRRHGRPRDTLPALHHVADCSVVVGRDGAPAALLEGMPLDLPGDAVGIDEAQRLL